MSKGIYTLNDEVILLPQISSKYAVQLEKLGIKTIKDLVTHFPRTYIDSSKVTPIEELYFDPVEKQDYLIKVKVEKFRSGFIRGGRTIQSATAYDETGSISLSWFNQAFLKTVFTNPETEFFLKGKVKPKGKTKLQFYPTLYEQVLESRDSVHLGRISPEYNLTEGITKKWFRNRINYLVKLVTEGHLTIPNELNSINIESDLESNLTNVHFPEGFISLEKSVNELSLMELINIHLKLLEAKAHVVKKKPIEIELEKFNKKLNKFIKDLPFKLTEDQEKTLGGILEKLSQNELLNELIQGDVGTGKTIIIIYLSYLFALNGLQTIVLAPTTVLARQHCETFIKFLPELKDQIELVIGENKKTNSKKIMIGTSAVLSRKDKLIKNIGLVVVDEQHRFGVKQREELLSPLNLGKIVPHFINMTATPIPRTIAETFFGDINVSVIKTKPKDRKDIKTHMVSNEKREDCFRWIEEKIKNEKEQVYWICSLIEDSEEIKAKSAKDTFKKLNEVFGKKINISLLHGKMKPEEKRKVMEEFKDGKVDLLVSTTVIEVGIDVSNANVMVIENAERFGLAQLHQIRGRIGRSNKQAYCFLFTEDKITPTAANRLKFFSSTNDGLKIAEFDLESRGPGEVYGTKQAGIPNLKIAKLNNLETIRKSKELAEMLYNRGIKKIELFQ